MHLVNYSLVLLLTLLLGCAARPLKMQRLNLPQTLAADGASQSITRCANQMAQSVAEMRQLSVSSNRSADYLQPREYDQLEQLLVNYLSCRRELQQISQSESSDQHLKRTSLRCQAQGDAELALLSVEAPGLWRAMNQAYHRSGIAAGSCDRILHEVTASQGKILSQEHQAQLQHVISRRGMLLPAVENEFRHAPPAEVLWDAGRTFGSHLRRCQNALITSTGRLKSPVARPLHFSDEERQQIRTALQPGDVLLTYTEGYASNLFIPGNFKHAATFIGTKQERDQAGFPQDLLLEMVGPNMQDLKTVLQQTTTRSGEAADVVESVAEGVQLCNLDRILNTRINRLVILRPQLNPKERAKQIADVLSYVGDEYDFSFDLTDASDQVCTEVVYRSLQGRGGIDLPLSEHAWRQTLTADDILRCCLRGDGKQFACILAVEESKTSPGDASILGAAEAQDWLSRLPGIGAKEDSKKRASQQLR